MCVEAVAHQFEFAVGRDERYRSVVVKTSQPENMKTFANTFFLLTCLNVEDKYNLKRNGTQEKTPFSGALFHILSHGWVCFVPTVSFC